MNEKVLGIRSLWWKEMLTFFVFEKVHRCYHSWCSTPKSNANAWADTHKKILEEGSVQITRFSWRLRNHSNQWRTQKLFMCGGFHAVAYGGHLYLVCALCDATVWHHIHVYIWMHISGQTKPFHALCIRGLFIDEIKQSVKWFYFYK